MKRVAPLTAVCSVSCALVACAVGPDYHRPAIETPAAYEYLPKDTADTINTEWWKQFGDPVLDQLIAEALANNKSVKQAAANVQQAAADPHRSEVPVLSAGRVRRGRHAPAVLDGFSAEPSDHFADAVQL